MEIASTPRKARHSRARSKNQGCFRSLSHPLHSGEGNPRCIHGSNSLQLPTSSSTAWTPLQQGFVAALLPDTKCLLWAWAATLGRRLQQGFCSLCRADNAWQCEELGMSLSPLIRRGQQLERSDHVWDQTLLPSATFPSHQCWGQEQRASSKGVIGKRYQEQV